MFEVGKKYRSIYSLVDYEVLYADEMGAYAKPVSGSATSRQRLEKFENYKEIKEPVVEKIVRYVSRSKLTKEFLTSYSKPDHKEIIGQFELTITDGVLTDAKVIKS